MTLSDVGLADAEMGFSSLSGRLTYSKLVAYYPVPPVGRKRGEDRRRSSRPSKKSPGINFLATRAHLIFSPLNNCATDREQLLRQIFAQCRGWQGQAELRIAHPPRPATHREPTVPAKNILTCAIQRALPHLQPFHSIQAIPQKVAGPCAESRGKTKEKRETGRIRRKSRGRRRASRQIRYI